MLNKYYIAIPAYNEEKAIGVCLDAIYQAAQFAISKFKLRATYICLNGCTDNTEAVIKNKKQEIPALNIQLLQSAKGMNRAIGKIIESLPNKSCPIIQIDADTVVDQKAFFILLTEFTKHPILQIVGGYPRAYYYQGKNLYKKFLSNVLDIRSRWPLSQIATNDVSNIHKIADLDSQPNIPLEFEKRSKIYFHGRFYALRNQKVWDVPAEQIGDDTYLTLSVYKRFGPNSIRIRYDAICYYRPTTSLIQHWKIYKRIHYDIKTLFNLPVFQEMQNFKSLEKTKLNWSYINTLPIKIRLFFICYTIIKFIENILFKIFPKYSEKLWVYDEKN